MSGYLDKFKTRTVIVADTGDFEGKILTNPLIF